jgi:acyl-coenzyme A synthetase/AMP-(fatty) acid ligase
MTSLAEHCRSLFALEPTREAIWFEDRWYSWGEVQKLAGEISAALLASGIGEFAPVTVVTRNRPELLASLIALFSENRSIRIVYAFQSAAAMARSIGLLDSPALIGMDQDFSAEVREVLAVREMAGIALGNMAAYACEGYERGKPRATADAGHPCVEILTSGTTGPPKQFPLPYRVIEQFIAGLGPVGMAGDDASAPPPLLTFPIGNIAGIFFAASSILQGKRTILFDRFTIEGWRDYIVTYRPTVAGAPTAALNLILDAGIPKQDLSSLRYLITGAAPLDPTVQRAFEEHYEIPILLSYGATEFGGPVTQMTPELHAEFGSRKLGSVGRPLAGVQLRVLSTETGTELGPDEQGIVEVISPRMGPDWIRTSDLGMIDQDGFFWHRGRSDGVIIRGGFKILPETIERALMLHPAISAAGVVGIADKRLGQVPAAAIQLKPASPAPSIAELEAHMRSHVLSTHIPVRWKIVGALPKNIAFKVDRPGLRQLFEDEHSPQ